AVVLDHEAKVFKHIVAEMPFIRFLYDQPHGRMERVGEQRATREAALAQTAPEVPGDGANLSLCQRRVGQNLSVHECLPELSGPGGAGRGAPQRAPRPRGSASAAPPPREVRRPGPPGPPTSTAASPPTTRSKGRKLKDFVTQSIGPALRTEVSQVCVTES